MSETQELVNRLMTEVNMMLGEGEKAVSVCNAVCRTATKVVAAALSHTGIVDRELARNMKIMICEDLDVQIERRLTWQLEQERNA